MIRIRIGFNGKPVEIKEFNTEAETIAFIDTLRSVQNRPAHLILETNNLPLIQKAIEMIYAAQVFAIWDKKIYGGMDYTRRYLAVHHHLADGGKIENIPTNRNDLTMFIHNHTVRINPITKEIAIDNNYLSFSDFETIWEAWNKSKGDFI